MTEYYILIYKKTGKKPFGILPTKKKVSKDSIRKQAQKKISKQFRYRIITKSQLSKLSNKLIR